MSVLGKVIKFLKKYVGVCKKAYTKKKILTSIIVDIVIVLLSLVILGMSVYPLQGWLTSLQELAINIQKPDLDPALANGMVASLKTLIVKIMSVAITVFVLITALASISRLFLWKRLTDSKTPSELINLKVKRYFKYALVQLISFIIFIVLPIILIQSKAEALRAIFMDGPKLNIFAITLMIYFVLYVHFAVIYNFIYAKSLKAFSSIKESFNVGTRYISHFVFPYIVMGVLVGALSPLYLLFNTVLSGWYLPVAYLVIFIIMITFFRLYLVRLIAIIHHRYKVDQSKN